MRELVSWMCVCKMNYAVLDRTSFVKLVVFTFVLCFSGVCDSVTFSLLVLFVSLNALKPFVYCEKY